jgi:flavodoxin
MKALVAYESKTGHTRQAAEAVAEAVRKMNGEAIVKPMAEVKASDVQIADVLFLGTWVQGHFFFNVKPAGAEQWVPNLPSLRGKPVGVFCTYLFNPRGALRSLSEMLESRGAKPRGEHAVRRSRPAEGAEEFVRGVLAAAAVP